MTNFPTIRGDVTCMCQGGLSLADSDASSKCTLSMIRGGRRRRVDARDRISARFVLLFGLEM
jgi:hypothetical protein